MAVASALPRTLSGSAAACNMTSSISLSSSCAGRWFVEDLETRGDIGLERELVQQPRAEGVDGLDLQAARCLERRREQPRAARASRVLGVAPVLSLICSSELGIVERRSTPPAA